MLSTRRMKKPGFSVIVGSSFIYLIYLGVYHGFKPYVNPYWVYLNLGLCWLILLYVII